MSKDVEPALSERDTEDMVVMQAAHPERGDS